MSLRICWWSNSPQVPSGYGVQTKLTVPRLAAMGHKMAILGYYGVQGGPINWNGIPVFPSHLGSYGQESVNAVGARWQADVVMPHMDIWVNDFAQAPTWPYVPYFPIDADRVSQANLTQARRSYRRITMSRWGQKMIQECGLECSYIPHMVDSKAFYPMDRRESRLHLRWDEHGITDDTFVVGMVQANVGYPSRKAFHEQFQGFKRFHDRHPDSVLYVHSHMAQRGEQGGPNLPQMVEYVGLSPDDVYFPDPLEYMMGYTDEQMRYLYAAFDVLLQVTTGEGCGVPLIEAAMCGTPAISGGWSAMPEHTFHGFIVPEEMSQKWYHPVFATGQWLPRIEGIDEALEQAYDGARSETRKRKAAQEAKANHDADMVASKHWGKFLRNLEHDLREDGLLYHQRVTRAQQEAEAEPVALAAGAGE